MIIHILLILQKLNPIKINDKYDILDDILNKIRYQKSEYKDIWLMYIKFIITNYMTEITGSCNISFIDIINYKISPLKLGFSGTPFTYLINNEPDDKEYMINRYQYKTNDQINRYKWSEIKSQLYKLEEKKFDNIIFQPSANGSIIYSITNDKCKLHYKESFKNQDILTLYNKFKYNAIIDIGVFFIGQNNKNVVKMFLNEKIHKYGIFFGKSDSPKLITYDSDDEKDLDSTFMSSQINLKDIIVFFDEGHTTGTDIKIYNLGLGLILVNDRCTFSRVAQGIFRMRNINKGQFVHIAHENICKNNVDLLFKLLNNDLKYQQQNYLYYISQSTKTCQALLSKNPKIEYCDVFKVSGVSDINDLECEKEKEKEKEKKKKKKKKKKYL